jgi:hypothetical protein
MPNSDETYDRRLIDTSDGINGNELIPGTHL